MKKKLIAGILSAGMVLSCAQALPQGVNVLSEIGVMNVNADEADGFRYSVGSSGATIERALIGAETLTIPATVGGNKVVAVGGTGALVLSKTNAIATVVKKVIISEGIQKLSGPKFGNYQNLESVTLPSTLTEIGDSVFTGKTLITSITLPSGLITIGKEAFNNCTGLTSITIPSTVTTIGESAFDECSNLKEVTVPKSVTSIGEKAFGYCVDQKTDKEKKDTGFLINCYKGSEAEKYAKKNGFQYCIIPSVKRLYGSDRYGTAVKISKTLKKRLCWEM